MAELVSMSDQFQGLSMENLIGGPLTAACDSQVMLARATADFIKVIGFLPPDDAKIKTDPNAIGATRTAAFKFKRPVELPAPPGARNAPNIGQEEVELEVPLLAIVNVPNLSITTVDVNFEMEVKSSFSTASDSSAEGGFEGSAKVGWGPFSMKVSVHGKVASHSSTTRKSDNSAKYSISVHAEDRGMPEGMARVMDILQSSIAPTKVSAATPGTTGGGGGGGGSKKIEGGKATQ